MTTKLFYTNGIHIELRFIFQFHVESWPKWDLNPQSCAYHIHKLTELSGQAMRHA